MGRLIFILGGARSGKSEHAQRLAGARPGPVIFIATAEALDEEMKRRIEAHRQSRPAAWQTLELLTGVGRHMLEHAASGSIVLLDCLTLLVSNTMLKSAGSGLEPDETAARTAVKQELQTLTEAISRSDSEWIVVSNEVGQGIVPAYAAGRLFRDLLGWANKEIAAKADEVIWMVAGIPVPITRHRLPGPA